LIAIEISWETEEIPYAGPDARHGGMSQRARLTLLTPIAGMLGVAFLIVAGSVSLDTGLSLLSTPELWLEGLQGGAALDRVANAAEVVAGVLAIATTVVAIVVELAANRYTHRITQLFVRERINQVVLAFFVLTTIVCLWVSVAPLEAIATARVSATLAMAMVTLCLLLLLPYFLFLFRFLSPRNVIERIAEQALDAARGSRRDEMLEAIEELEDMARGAHQHHDRSIALASADALANVVRGYRQLCGELPPAWFKIDRELARDPDFVALAPSARIDLEDQRPAFARSRSTMNISDRVWLDPLCGRSHGDPSALESGSGRVWHRNPGASAMEHGLRHAAEPPLRSPRPRGDRTGREDLAP
jgi:hypothetical protein